MMSGCSLTRAQAAESSKRRLAHARACGLRNQSSLAHSFSIAAYTAHALRSPLGEGAVRLPDLRRAGAAAEPQRAQRVCDRAGLPQKNISCAGHNKIMGRLKHPDPAQMKLAIKANIQPAR